MRKSLVGAILCVMVTYNASASIISRGFFDEAMENYATNTALDLKANQSDLVNLSNIVGTPMEMTYDDILRSTPYIDILMGNVYQDTYADNTVPTNDISELINLNYTDKSFPGLAGVVQSLFERRNSADPWPIRLYEIFNDYEHLNDEGYSSFADLIFDGGSLSNNEFFYGLPNLTTMIGTVPDGKNLVGMISETNAKIGTLPSGIFPIFSGAERLLPRINEPFTYPTSLAELINAIYGNSETGQIGLLEGIIGGFPYIQYGDDRPDDYIGLIHNFEHARNAKELAIANTAKIGTVPDGKNLAGMIGTLPDGYDSVGAALTAMDAKITAKNLPSTSDDGQYVLTAKKVGETITYTWVKMDLTNEEQIQ